MEIISISTAVINDSETNSVNARDLHRVLEIRKDFSNWIKAQINRAGLEENVDFITLTQKGVGGRFDSIEYILTLDAAKHISMLSSSPKGKAVRDYFIEAEKQLRQTTNGTVSSQLENIILRQNALLAEVVQELRVTQQAVIEAKDETISIQREAIELLANANQTKNITINKTTVKTKNTLFPGIAEEVFVEAAAALLKRFKSGLNQSQLLAHLGRMKGDKTARTWLQNHIGVYWDVRPSSNRQYIYTLIEG